jgi:tetratricopeptide (TPR) repeat protein
MSETRQDLARARDLLTQAIALYRKMGDRNGEARCLNSLGVVDRSAGRPTEAEERLREAIAIREELGQIADGASALNNLGILLLDRGAWTEAIDVLTETRERDRAADDEWGVACCTLNLAVAHLVGSNVDEATQELRDALVSFVELGDWDGLLETLEAVVGVASAIDDWTGAARLGGAADAARVNLGLPGSPADRAHFEGWTGRARSNLGPGEYEAAEQEGRTMSLERATSYALSDVLNHRGEG